MNIILLEEQDITHRMDVDCFDASITDERRVQHIRQILKSKSGDRLNIGLLNERLGTGRLVEQSTSSLRLECVLDRDPPQPLPVTLLLALPRPLVMRRLLADVTSLGVKRMMLLHTARVEKSYWQSPVLQEAAIGEALRKGLEQARDCRLPEVIQCRDLRQFTRDELPRLVAASTQALIADPAARNIPVVKRAGSILLAIGPEGGFHSNEIRQFTSCGFEPIHCGERVLRVETAVAALLGFVSMV